MQEWILVCIWKLFFMLAADGNPDYAAACDRLTCKIGEHCVIRRFWCDYTLCPTFSYCSKSRLESLRGPDSCESVVCPYGYRCILRVHNCVSNHDCKQRLARCISDVEFADEPATCEDIKCGKGHRCILREMHYCPKPPCRLIKSCAYSEDVEMWFEKCRQLGCRSEHECFLRKPSGKCATSSCDHTPACLIMPDTYVSHFHEIYEDQNIARFRRQHSRVESTSSKLCFGWICPADQVCSARLPISCSSPGVNCPILRSCVRNLRDLAQGWDARTSLTDLERDIFLEEQRKLQQYIKPSFISNFTQTRIQKYYDDVLPRIGQAQKNLGDAASASMQSRRVSMSPIMRSTSEDGDSAWLTYLKRRAGAEAVRYWIDKAKSNQDYEGFVEWLDMVSQLLDPDTYRLWLMEVKSASANVPEFQAWISPRNLAAHRLASASTTQTTLPVSIADRTKHFLYSDKSLVFADQQQKPTESRGTSRQRSNFKFNEASQLGDGPLAHLEIPAQLQGPSDVGYGLPQDFGEAVKNSWKSWQSYYQLNPLSLSEFAGRMANTHLGNYTKAPHQNAGVPQMFFMDDRYATTFKRDDNDVVARIGGFKNFRANVAQLDPEQSASQLMLSSPAGDDDNLPNLLIYFPPPLNFFIYYTFGHNNLTATGNINLQTDDNINSDPRSEEKTRMFNSGGYVPEDYDYNFDFYNKTSPTNKQKEFEFIRKIIRELINYWDDEERTFEKSRDSTVGVRMANFDDSPSYITNTQTDKMKPDEDEGKPSFNTFLEWLFKNGHINSTPLSDLNSRKKQPPVNEEQKKTNFNSPNLEKNTNTMPEKLRILVDIDKNSEIMKKILSRNNRNNQNDLDPQQYEVIVNLNDYTDPQEEDLISRKLINIASKKLHRNMTGDEKMPKVLWVFPVYENEENETIINEIKKRSKEKVNTLEDVDAPTESTDDNDRTYYKPNSPDVNSDNDDDTTQNLHNFNDSIKNIQNEYYDDQDMYDEDDYEESELDQSKEHI